jgi:hypothetical protein
VGANGITSLKHNKDTFDTDYIQYGRTLGPMLISYRHGNDAWKTQRTTLLEQNLGNELELRQTFELKDDALIWKILLRNLTDRPIEIGDLGFSMPFNTRINTRDKTVAYTQRQIPHFWVAGHGSFIYLMRPNSVGPYLVMMTIDWTKLEYFDRDGQGGGGGPGGNVMFIHSKAASDRARERGGNWRLPNTSKFVAPREGTADTFKLCWAADYQGVRQALYQNGLLDIHVAPGMTVPAELSALVAIRGGPVWRVEPEHPDKTKVEHLGERDGGTHLYKVTFQRLGENLLTVNHGEARQTFLEFLSSS